MLLYLLYLSLIIKSQFFFKINFRILILLKNLVITKYLKHRSTNLIITIVYSQYGCLNLVILNDIKYLKFTCYLQRVLPIYILFKYDISQLFWVFYLGYIVQSHFIKTIKNKLNLIRNSTELLCQFLQEFIQDEHDQKRITRSSEQVLFNSCVQVFPLNGLKKSFCLIE